MTRDSPTSPDTTHEAASAPTAPPAGKVPLQEYLDELEKAAILEALVRRELQGSREA